MKINPKTASKELKRRQAMANARPVEDELDFKAQNDFVNDPSRFLLAQCSRRAGKTNALGKKFLKTMEKYPNSQCVYLALTYESAKDIMIPVLTELNEKFNLGCTFTEGVVRHPNGSKLRLLGADMKNFIKRLKGRKYPGVAIDEAQDFGPHLISLVDDVLTPAIADYTDGWLALTGTPGPVPQGYFFEVTQQRKYGFSFHGWTIFDNPFMPNPRQFLEDLKKRKQWDDENPTLKREWLNKWVLDTKSLWINYDESKCHYETLPQLPTKLHYILGIDIGFRDADALAVLAYSDVSKDTYLVEEVVTTKQGLTELVAQVQDLRKKYDFSKMVIDEGGLGKKLAEEMRRQHAIPVEPADKLRKQENVEFLNDAMRLGKFKAKRDSRFAKDSYLVQIDWDKSTPSKIIIKKHPHSDIIDAVLYAFKESPAWGYEAVAPKPKIGSPEWAAQQVDDMFNKAVDHFQEQAEIAKRLEGWDGD